MIEIKTGAKGGIFVKDLNAEQMSDSLGFLVRSQHVSLGHLAQFREDIEGLVAARAAQQAGPEDIADLKRLLKRAASEMEAGMSAWSDFMTTDMHIHLALADIAGNPLHRFFLETIHDNIHKYNIDYFLPKETGTLEAVFKDLKDLVEAVARSDAKEARIIAQNHIHYFNRLMEQAAGKSSLAGLPSSDSASRKRNRRPAGRRIPQLALRIRNNRYGEGNMLILSEQDIRACATPAEILDRVESILKFYETGNFYMPMRTHLDYLGNTLLLMPCFTDGVFGTKLITLFPGNVARGKPMINATMVLNDAETGEPLALLNGKVLTAMRTGAVGGVGVRWLSPREPHALGLVGAGVQGLEQVRFASAARKLTSVTVYDARKEAVPAFLERLSAFLPGVPLNQAGSIEDLLTVSRTVITATTADEPVLPDDPDLLRGRHFIGIGSYKPTMREFPESLFRLLDRMYIDTDHAFEESGDLITPLEQGWLERDRVMTLGSLIESGRYPEEAETTLVKSVGMALLDVGVAQSIYEKARDKGLGREIVL